MRKKMLLDKGILFLLCSWLLFYERLTPETLLAALAALFLSSLAGCAPGRLSGLCAGALALCCTLWPPALAFTPLLAYDAQSCLPMFSGFGKFFRELVSLVWLIPLAAGAIRLEFPGVLTALLLSLTLSFVPRLRRRLEETDRAQRGLLGQPRRRLDKVGWGAALLSSLLGWSLENAIETADTMRSRGYGLPGRTCFSIYRLDRRDKGLLGWLALSGGYVVAGWAAGGLSYTYYPACQAAGGPGSLSLLTVYLALCLTPLALEAWEERQWKRTTKNTGR